MTLTSPAVWPIVPAALRHAVVADPRAPVPCVRPGCGHVEKDHWRWSPREVVHCSACGCVRWVAPTTLTGPPPVVVYVAGDLAEDAEGALAGALRDLLNGAPALRRSYIGAKRYDGFHQGIACEYGMRPRHGEVVLEVGLRPEVRARVGERGLLTVGEIAASWEWLAGRPLPPFTRTFLRWQDALARLREDRP